MGFSVKNFLTDIYNRLKGIMGSSTYDSLNPKANSSEVDGLSMDGGWSSMKLVLPDKPYVATIIQQNESELHNFLGSLVNNITKEDFDKYYEAYTAFITPNTNGYNDLFHANNIFFPGETDYYNKRYRFGVLNTYENLTNCREYLFFTKPDLCIMKRNDDTGEVRSDALSDELAPRPFWEEMFLKYPEDIAMLQATFDYHGSVQDPFNNLLGNMVNSSLSVPDLSAEMTDTPANLYGISYSYRGSSEASDRNINFSLEFKDTKFLPVYNFFRAYEEYQTLRKHGTITPWKKYVDNKILYDQYSIYKFLVDEDGETIVYYAKLVGVKSKSLPREIFNSTTFDDGIKFSVDFEAAFFDDMNPQILSDFNRLAYSRFKAFEPDGEHHFEIGPYNYVLDRVDNRPARAAIITREESGNTNAFIVGVDGEYISDPYTKLHDKAPGKYVYKLRWRGDDQS